MLFREIIVDNFAGGGGASSGIEMATGRSVDIAINHDPDAIAMHKMNHPDTTHFCENVWDIDPRKAVAGLPVGLCWLSPDCKHFSKAKGGKPVEKAIRGLAWVAVRWAYSVKPRVIMLENVEEFRSWGPIDDGFPCPLRKGETFEAFKLALSTGLPANHPGWLDIYDSIFRCNYDVTYKLEMYKAIKRGCGYQLEFKELRACDFGAPTIRKRLFMVARRDGQPIKWPKPKHGAPDSKDVKSGKLKPYRTAAECIDWSLPCPSIFERKRPLAENTMRRIAKGIQKFVIDAEQPFLINTRNGERKNQAPRTRDINEPYWTVTSQGSQGAIVEPVLAPCFHQHAHVSDTDNLSVNELMAAENAADDGEQEVLISPIISRQFGKSIGHSVDNPAGTVTAGGGGKSLLVSSHLIKFRGTCRHGQPVTEPMPTITAGGLHVGEVRAFLLKYYGTNIGHACDQPIQTITTKHRFGLVTVEGVDYQIVDIGMRMLQPRELFLAQGFVEDYIIDVDQDGNPIPKAKQVARCGNAVPPPFAKALVEVNLPELCHKTTPKAA